MKKLIILTSLLFVSLPAFAQVNVAEMIENEKNAITVRLENGENTLKLQCQDELTDILNEVSAMDAAVTPADQLLEDLELVTMRREYVESADSNCLLTADEN